MNKKKTFAVAVVLVLVLLIGGMLAYFTDTDTVTNVFTIGDNVDIALSETWTQSDGQGIHPGAVVTKAPSIKNVSSTTPAYVFAEVIVPCYAASGVATDPVDTPLFSLLNSSNGAGPNSGWALINTPSVNTTNKTITYVYAYGTTSAMTSLAANNTTTTTPVFSKVKLAETLTDAQKATASTTPNIVINAYGIQTDGLGVTAPSAIFALFP